MMLILILMTSGVDVDIGADLGVRHRYVQSEAFSLENLSVNRASLEVDAELFSGCDAEIEVDFSDGLKLKNAWIGYQPIEFFALRIGRQKLPVSLEELTSYYKRAFLENTWGNKLIDEADYVGRNLGARIKGKVPLGNNSEINLYTGLFSPPSSGWGQFVCRLVIEIADHHIGGSYSSRSGFFEVDSVLWTTEFHLDLPVLVDAEVSIGPDIRAFWVGARTGFFDNRLQPAIRYQWCDCPGDFSTEIDDMTFSLTGQFSKYLRIQAEVSVPLVRQTTPIRFFTGVKIHF